MNIVTHFVHPPIPDRRCDWSAVTEDYDGPGSPIGYGRTEAAAIADLLEQIEERAPTDLAPDRRIELLQTENQLLRAQLALIHLRLQRQLRMASPLSILPQTAIANDPTTPALLRRQAE